MIRYKNDIKNRNLRSRKISKLNAQDNLILRSNANLAIQICMAIVFIRLFLSLFFSFLNINRCMRKI